MKNSEKNNKSCSVKTSIGGQALIEGIMMRGPKLTSMAVRRPDGSICLETSETKLTGSKLFKIPIVRGVVSFVSSMAAGYKALMRSAEIAMPEEEDETEGTPENKAGDTADAENAAEETRTDETAAEKAAEENASAEESSAEEIAPEETPVAEEKTEEKASEKKEKAGKKGSDSLSGQMTVVMVISIVVALALSIFLFKVIPETVYELLSRAFPALKEGGWGANFLRSLLTGIMKILILIGYMAAVSLMKDIRRTFMYHGAEHKTIFCYEAGLPLTVENVRRQRRFHPRCGTSFLILSVLVSVFFTMFIPADLVGSRVLNVLARTGISLLMLPIIMGAGYELIRLAGRHDNAFTRFISAPGVWLQHITTKEPDDGMIECAIAAVKEVIPGDGSDLL